MNTAAGYIVSWHVPATVELSGLRTALVQAGLPPDMAPDLKPGSLVARASSYIARATSVKDARKLSRPVTHASRQITREEIDPLANLTYTKEAEIHFDDATGKLASSEPSVSATLDDTTAHITETRTASDVTRTVQRAVEMAGSDLIPVRDQGGAYFIPAGHAVISQVGELLEAIGGELSTFACTLGHGSDESIANVITDYMLKQIGELKTSIDELNEKGIRSDVKSRRLTRVAELRERISAYATLVNTQGSKLTDALNVAEAMLLAKLGPSAASDADDPTLQLEEVAA
jgi:hypothetical protein